MERDEKRPRKRARRTDCTDDRGISRPESRRNLPSVIKRKQTSRFGLGSTFVVDRLLACSMLMKGGLAERKFVVRWKDYDDKWDTWESEDDIEPSLVAEFDLSPNLKCPWRGNEYYLVERVLERRAHSSAPRTRTYYPVSPTPIKPAFDFLCGQARSRGWPSPRCSGSGTSGPPSGLTTAS